MYDSLDISEVISFHSVSMDSFFLFQRPQRAAMMNRDLSKGYLKLQIRGVGQFQWMNAAKQQFVRHMPIIEIMVLLRYQYYFSFQGEYIYILIKRYIQRHYDFLLNNLYFNIHQWFTR